MRRIEAVEIKESANVNQINPSPIHNPGCSYCQAPNHVFESAQFFKLINYHWNTWMRPTQGRRIIPTHKLTIPVGEITLMSLGARTILLGLISPIIFTIPIFKQTFPINRPLLLSKTHQWRKNSVNWRRVWRHSWRLKLPSCKIQDKCWTIMYMPYLDWKFR